ncbi:hypothetical protein [Exiguobacterium sp. s28]|uniref:hypothetical protein n=1 Tax=Exiguobacterium sp. s28 TaxID=2751238 RepID=UPI001BE63073|nr:hypothetical protein [Exiguobacterium sp. s28]
MNLTFYREYVQDSIESKSFKLTTESRFRINFISNALEMKQGDVLEMLIDHFYSDEKMYGYLISEALDNPIDFKDLNTDLIDDFTEYLRHSEFNKVSNPTEIFKRFQESLDVYLKLNETSVSYMIQNNQKLGKYFGDSISSNVFTIIFPYWAKEMFQVYQNLANFMDFNEKNIMFLNALALRDNPQKYVALRIDCGNPMVQSIVEKALADKDNLSPLWRDFNFNFVNAYAGDISFHNIYQYINDEDIKNYKELVYLFDKTTKIIEGMAPPIKSKLFI